MSAAKKPSVNEIDALLPQTQCGLCHYNGCRPYAEAIVLNNEKINRCPPGGVATLQKLALATHQDATPYIAEMQRDQKPPSVAVIREPDCIGCAKCLNVCPTDAIIGASKQMHTVILDACTGCDLCVKACPVDCIDIIEIPERDEKTQQLKANEWRDRYENHLARLAREKTEEKSEIAPLEIRKQNIAEILKRMKK